MAIQTKIRQTDSAAEITAPHVDSISVLERILLRVRLRARRRAAWLAHLGDGGKAEAHLGLDQNLASCLDGRDRPEAEATWYERAEAVQPLNEEIVRVERAIAGTHGARLNQLRSLFRLSAQEIDLLQACVAPAVDPTVGAVYAYLQHPARNYATEALATRLFGYEHCSLWYPSCPLAVWGLISAGEAAPGEPSPLVVDPLVIDWLQGELHMDSALGWRVQIVNPRSPLESWPVETTAQLIQRAIEREVAVRVLLIGSSASGRRTLAAVVAARFGVQTLAVDTTGSSDTDWPDTYMHAQRMAVLGGMALVWQRQRATPTLARHCCASADPVCRL